MPDFLSMKSDALWEWLCRSDWAPPESMAAVVVELSGRGAYPYRCFLRRLNDRALTMLMRSCQFNGCCYNVLCKESQRRQGSAKIDWRGEGF